MPGGGWLRGQPGFRAFQPSLHPLYDVESTAVLADSMFWDGEDAPSVGSGLDDHTRRDLDRTVREHPASDRFQDRAHEALRESKDEAGDGVWPQGLASEFDRGLPRSGTVRSIRRQAWVSASSAVPLDSSCSDAASSSSAALAAEGTT